VLSYDIVLYDGTNVTASAEEHEDLYWALRGGGSGFGVITSIETAIIGAPKASSGFTFIGASYKQTQNEAREFLKRFQDFLMPDLPIGSKEYKEKVRATSAKFGGGASFNTNSTEGTLGFSGLFLGSADEARSTFAEAGLLDPDILVLDSSGFATLEFSSYVDAQLYIICFNLGLSDYRWTEWVDPNRSYNETDNVYKVDICEDLGIDSKYCYRNNVGYLIPNCYTGKDVILPALKSVAIKPQSWFNRPGPGRPGDNRVRTTWTGGLLYGRVDPDVLLEMANVGVSIGHFAHGKLCFWVVILSLCVRLLIFTSLCCSLPYPYLYTHLFLV